MDSAGRFDHLAPRNPNTAAIERAAQSRNPRAVTAAGKKTRVSKNHEFEPWDTDHPIRQEFRRLLDPGILRNNDKKDAAESLRVLNKITENILKNPDVPKYRKLDPTKRMMNLHIMSKKGTVEFLQRMGFREKREELVPFLVFHPDRMKDLRTGAKCLEEVMHNQVQAIEDAERAKRQEIVNQNAAKSKALKKVYDDRLSVAARVERERLERERGVTQTEAESSEPPADEMAGLKIKTLSDYPAASQE